MKPHSSVVWLGFSPDSLRLLPRFPSAHVAPVTFEGLLDWKVQTASVTQAVGCWLLPGEFPTLQEDRHLPPWPAASQEREG